MNRHPQSQMESTENEDSAPAHIGPRRIEYVGPRRALAKRALGFAVRKLRRAYFSTRFAAFGVGSSLGPRATLFRPERISVGSAVSIGSFARMEVVTTLDGEPAILIADHVNIQPYCHIAAAASVSIGRHSVLAAQAYISDHDHDYRVIDEDRPATDTTWLSASPVVIEEEVWIGEKVCVLKGVRIGRNSIIGAGSVVAKDVPPYCIAVGVPARVVKTYDFQSQDWRKV